MGQGTAHADHQEHEDRPARPQHLAERQVEEAREDEDEERDPQVEPEQEGVDRAKGEFAARADGTVLGHEERAAAGYALDDAKEASPSRHLSVRGQLDGTAHPGKFAGFGDDGFVGFENEFEHRHGGADDLRLHEDSC